MWTSVPQIPQCVTRISMSVSVKGFGVKVVNFRGLVASWATQPLKSFAGGEDMFLVVVLLSMLVVFMAVEVSGSCA